MKDISKGRWWDLPWSLISGCTPCSPGCERCWALAMEKRFHKGPTVQGKGIHLHPDRLTIPLRRRKPTVWAVWNDLFHEAVPYEFQREAFEVMRCVVTGQYCHDHTFLVLTKRPQIMADFIARLMEDKGPDFIRWPLPWVYLGLTVCNQAEADAKIPQMPDRFWLSLEPLLGHVDISPYFFVGDCAERCPEGNDCSECNPGWANQFRTRRIIGVVLGGETGPGARPMHPDWVRSVRDQCSVAGVPFFFKQWGEWAPSRLEMRDGCVNHTNGHYWWEVDPESGRTIRKIGRRKAGRLLDGVTHDELPWRAGA